MNRLGAIIYHASAETPLRRRLEEAVAAWHPGLPLVPIHTDKKELVYGSFRPVLERLRDRTIWPVDLRPKHVSRVCDKFGLTPGKPFDPTTYTIENFLASRSSASESEPGAIGALAARLQDACIKKRYRDEFARWIRLSSERWRAECRPALAGIIEAAVWQPSNSLPMLIEQVLANEHSPDLVATVAAQRARLVKFEAIAQAERVGHFTVQWIERWERDDNLQSAALALPSLPFLLGSTCLPLLAERLRRGSRIVAWGAAVGLSDHLQSLPTSQVGDEYTEIVKSALERALQERANPIEPDGKDVVALLVWIAGLATGPATLASVANLVVRCFTAPTGAEDAGAVRAGRAMNRRHGASAIHALQQAFLAAEAEVGQHACARYLSSVLLQPKVG